jgi:hypothetical protein
VVVAVRGLDETSVLELDEIVTCHLLTTIGRAWASARWWGGARRSSGCWASKSWRGGAPEAAEWSPVAVARLGEEAATGREAKPVGPM